MQNRLKVPHIIQTKCFYNHRLRCSIFRSHLHTKPNIEFHIIREQHIPATRPACLLPVTRGFTSIKSPLPYSFPVTIKSCFAMDTSAISNTASGDIAVPGNHIDVRLDGNEPQAVVFPFNDKFACKLKLIGFTEVPAPKRPPKIFAIAPGKLLIDDVRAALTPPYIF